MRGCKNQNKLIVLPNEDNKFHEEVDYTNLAKFPHPFRLILCGPPNMVRQTRSTTY